MGSPGCDQVGSTVHLPHLMDHRHNGTALSAWQDEEEDVKPPRGLLGLPERNVEGLYLPCWDMLVTEDSSLLLKAEEAEPPTEPPCKAPQQCPVIHSQGLGLSSGLEGQVEERCLEQVQSMVVGEVLKDIETACKLLNITPGKKKSPLNQSMLNTGYLISYKLLFISNRRETSQVKSR